MNDFFKNQGIRHIYGYGFTGAIAGSTVTSFGVYIKYAIALRDKGPANSFKLVYPWIVNSATSVKAFLAMGVDGMITDDPQKVKQVVEASTTHRLAVIGDNPFA